MRACDLVVGRWGARFRGRSLPCAIGRGGIARDKREGDGATPEGVHRFTGMLFRPDRIARGAVPDWALPLGPSDGWSDDPADPDYNRMIRRPHGFGHERLRRADPLYDVILTTDWNWPWAKPRRGSAIFVHAWRRPRHATAGCVAFSPGDLLWIARRLEPGSRLVVRA